MNLDITEIQNGITICKKPEDIICSEVAKRIFDLVTKKNKNQDISRFYSNFLKSFPISEENLSKLKAFFEDKNNQDLAQNIFSRLYLLVGDNNKDFVNSFLKNEQGNNDSSKIINFILEQLEKYPFITKFPIDSIETEIKEKTPYETHRFFKYKNSKKLGLIAQSKDGLINTQNIYSNINHIKNDVFLGIRGNIGEFIKFNGENFEIIQIIEDINGVPEKILKNGDIIYKNINGKNKLILFSNLENNISEYEYEKIEERYGFLFANKINSNNPSKIDLDIFSNTLNKSFQEIYGYEISGIKNLIDLLKIKTQIGLNYFEIKTGEDTGKIKEIPYLKNIKGLSNSFFKSIKSGKLAFLENAIKGTYAIQIDKDNIISFPIKGKEQESVLIKNIEQKQFLGLDEKNYPCFVVDGNELYIFDRQNRKLYKYGKSIQNLRRNANINFDNLVKDKSISEIKAESI